MHMLADVAKWLEHGLGTMNKVVIDSNGLGFIST